LPPAFPAVRIDGELYWDGGILSNTPTEVVFDDAPRRSSLIFAARVDGTWMFRQRSEPLMSVPFETGWAKTRFA
jgi:predicted acylesterase/phospholipase RssA